MSRLEVNDIAAILVLYNCPMNESLTLQSLNSAGKAASTILKVFVYDNSAERQKAADFSNLEIVETYHDAGNPGVSKAYNHFAEKLKNQFSWFLLLDQDTQFPEGYFRELLEVEEYNSELILPRLMQGSQLISPHGFYNGYSRSIAPPATGLQPLTQRSALNSGILISSKAFKEAGGYAEDVPLYFSDQVFIQRLKDSGIDHYYLLNSVCTHQMASNDISNIPAFKRRFELFVKGARAAQKHFKGLTRQGLKALILLRAAKLSMKFKDTFYLRQAFLNHH